MSGWYMASTSRIDPKYNTTMGIVYNVGTVNKGFYTTRNEYGVPFCLDNQVFTGKFNETEWKKAIEKCRKYQEYCLFVVIPDVVGDAQETVRQFHYYRGMVKGFPVAFVSQDGIMDEDIPWDDFDCLFIGGSDNHKLRKEGGWIINEAKKHKKWIHVGRVNSPSRILKFWQADSWDGTHLGFYPSDVSKFHAAVLQVRAMKQMRGLL